MLLLCPSFAVAAATKAANLPLLQCNLHWSDELSGLATFLLYQLLLHEACCEVFLCG